MKKESIDKVIGPIMDLIMEADINGEDKTELTIVLGRLLENYDFEKYSELIYGKKLVKKYENIQR